MEPPQKRRRIDEPPSNNYGGHSNGEAHNTYPGHVSSTFDGSGISNTNGNFHVGGNISINCNPSSQKTSASDARKSLLESLWFDQIDAREWSIKEAHANTCRWFLHTESYKQWEESRLSDHANFLWIKGKPGAGKSTLMKFLLHHIRSRLRQNNVGNDILVSFFFDARGDELEKTTTGLYRSLLWQLLNARPELQHILDTLRPSHQWSIGSLTSLIKEAMQILAQTRVVCLIDALDECDVQQIRDMVFLLKDLVDKGGPLYICFASRHYPHITVEGLEIILEERNEHQQDITAYLSSALRIGHSKLSEQIRSELQEKACGVFMWVVLVVDILNQEYDAGQMHSLRQRLRQLPGDLHALFHDILTRDVKRQDSLLLCIQWLLFAKRPLTPKQLYLAVLSGTESSHLEECHSDDISEDDVLRYILDTSKGLAESTKSEYPTIHFIHESVRDSFLKEDGLGKLFPSLGTNIPGRSHEALKQCCLSYMDMTALLKFEESPYGLIIATFPFSEYANQGILYHADQAESHDISQCDFLNEFDRSKWIKHYNLIYMFTDRRYTPKASLLYILAAAGTPALIRASPCPQSCFDIEDERYGVPILAAAAMRNSTAIEVMLDLQAQRLPNYSPTPLWRQLPFAGETWYIHPDFHYERAESLLHQLVQYGNEAMALSFLQTEECNVHLRDNEGMTALMSAAEKGHAFLVKQLLESSAAISADVYGRTPLDYAVRSGNSNVVELLINHGADASAADKDGWTPLHSASQQGNVELVQLLINHGANGLTCNGYGDTSLNIAQAFDHTEIVKLISENIDKCVEA
ncbi:uncharacterized protein JN550_007425 [Neoarthrinium moseri]|uniref:uncharacterized protein n=1 Tax=Neoarthrinium moseri TaxID=1658444 RepID=UPI001FDBA91A|nr:uncharacterized protein JN550_007425 [Neoarthrinium moseri]KAI1866878.1 hypothetical protein JN550_007425 [Neoarthrinium moseri]